MFLKKAIKEYNNQYDIIYRIIDKPVDQSQSSGASDIENRLNDNILETQNKLHTLCLDIFVALNKSILSGEYITESDFQKTLKDWNSSIYNQESELEGLIQFNTQQLDDLTDDNLKPISDKIKIPTSAIRELIKNVFEKMNINCIYIINVLKDIRLIIRSYDYLINIASNKIGLNNEPKQLLFNHTEDNKENVNTPILNSIINHTLFLSVLDYNISLEDVSLHKKLIEKRKEIIEQCGENDKTIQVLYKLLENKCNYFLYLIYSKQKIHYSKNYALETVDITTLKYGPFDSVINDISVFSNSSEYEYENPLFREIIDVDTENNPENINFHKFVNSMKYYKNGEGNIDSVNKLIKLYSSKKKSKYSSDLSELHNNYNQYAINSITSYLLNSKFSFALDCSNSTDYDKLTSEFNIIKNTSKTTKVKNYYSLKKYNLKLHDIIEDKINNGGVCEKMIDKHLKKLEGSLETQIEHIQWCKTRNFYPFQLPFEESFYDVEDLDFKIFIPLTTRPINYSNEIKEYDSQVQRLQTLKQQKNILVLLRKNEDVTNKVEKELKESTRKNIEYLSIFTAILTLLISVSVQAITNNRETSLSLIMANMTGIGSVLLLFVSILLSLSPFVTTNFKNYFKSGRNIFLFSFSLIMILSLGFFYYKFYQLENPLKSKELQETKVEMEITDNNNNANTVDSIPEIYTRPIP